MEGSIAMKLGAFLQEQEQEEEIDYFDQLPDPILGIIFNKIYDARSLCRCLAVSKRFASLIPEVGSVCITANHPKLKKPLEDGSKSRNGSKNLLKNFLTKFLSKPLSFLQQAILNSTNSNRKLINSSRNNNFGTGVDIFNWVEDVLKNFRDVESIKLELPCHGGEIGVNKNIPLLKWEAGYGKGMEGCVIIGATSISQMKNSSTGTSSSSSNSRRNGVIGENDEEEIFSDDELRLRIIWIISCLIASSGRHNLMKKMLVQCPKLSNAVISDAGKQGKLYMNESQVEELRNSVHSGENVVAEESSLSSSASQMKYVGNLVMKLWYVKELELVRSGQVMKGATLVVIKPENKAAAKEGESDGEGDGGVGVWGGFEGDKVFEEASMELLKRKEKRVYRLEVNSF